MLVPPHSHLLDNHCVKRSLEGKERQSNWKNLLLWLSLSQADSPFFFICFSSSLLLPPPPLFSQLLPLYSIACCQASDTHRILDWPAQALTTAYVLGLALGFLGLVGQPAGPSSLNQAASHQVPLCHHFCWFLTCQLAFLRSEGSISLEPSSPLF